ncbi:TerB family tellurite resistance protein [Dyadobacter frigoris]|uniref:TerB family tellurite resistance protein n=1 Tax=Dyadobacter frigoris TaxID=2576211 RepID=A0A4U6CQM1_9BACT|nr:TerB family tellurite resistance protein [Dyadobacter frigoris]TKT85737.1 TerB family tellurite resistance protein [Dyadobacter frigoris]
MKKLLLALLFFTLAQPVKLHAQTAEVTQLILNIEKLNQLRKILQELKEGYDILFKGYTLIRDLSKSNFNLHQAFLDGLLEVSPGVKNYQRIKDIIALQLALLKEYQAAQRHFSASGFLNPDEMDYLESVYGRLIKRSVKNLDALTDVLTAKKLRMSDDERLKAVDSIYEDMTESLVFLRQFNASTSVLALQRKKEYQDIKMSQTLHGQSN